MHRLVVGVAGPHPHHQVGRIAHRPVVAEIGRRPGLDRRRAAELEDALLAKGGGAGRVVGQDVGDQVGHPLVQHPLAGAARLRPEQVPRFILHAEDGHRPHHATAVGKGGIGRRLFQQAHLAAAQCHGQPQPLRVIESGDAQPPGQVGHGLHADGIQHLDGDQVVGGGQRLAEQHRTAKLQVIVEGHIGRALFGHKGGPLIEHHRRRGELAAGKGRRVGNRLDGGAGLPQGRRAVHRAVYAGRKIIGAAHQGQNLARLRVQGDQGGVAHIATAGRAIGPVAVALGQAGQVVADDVAGRLVEVEVQGGIDAQPALLQPLQAQLLLQQPPDVHHKVGGADGKGRGSERQPLCLGLPGLRLGDEPLLDHQPQDDRLPRFGPLPVLERVVVGRRLNQPDQQGALGQVQVADVLAKVGLGRRLDAVGHVAEIDFVQVKGQDFVFGVAAGDAPGQQRLPQLAAVGLLVPLFGVHQQVAGQLLGDGAGPGDDPPVAQVEPGRTEDGPQVHAGVFVKAGVLRGDDGLPQRRGHLGQRHRRMKAAVRRRHLEQQPPFAVIDLAAGRGGIGVQPRRIVQRGQVGEQSAVAQPPGQEDQAGQAGQRNSQTTTAQTGRHLAPPAIIIHHFAFSCMVGRPVRIPRLPNACPTDRPLQPVFPWIVEEGRRRP